jgi:hypothetical protein
VPRKKNPPPATLVDSIGAAPDGMTDLRARTYPGQAHFAEAPYGGATCRECSFWMWSENKSTYYAETGMIKKSHCDKARQLMGRWDTPRVPHFAPACKHFKEDPGAPPAYKHEQTG